MVYSTKYPDVFESLKLCESDSFTKVFAGNLLMPGMETYATCHGGHQLWNLGDMFY